MRCWRSRLRGVRINVAAATSARFAVRQNADAALTELSDKLGMPVGIEELQHNRWFAGLPSIARASNTRARKRQSIVRRRTKRAGMDRHPHWLPQLIRKTNKYHIAGANFVGKYILDYTVDDRIHAEIHPPPLRGRRATKSFRFSYSNPPLQLMSVTRRGASPSSVACSCRRKEKSRRYDAE